MTISMKKLAIKSNDHFLRPIEKLSIPIMATIKQVVNAYPYTCPNSKT